MSELVLITGASSGIGWALAQAYLQRGARVVLVARRAQALQEALAQAGWPSDRWRVYGADVVGAQAMQTLAR